MCVCLLFLKKNLKKREKTTQPMGRHSCMRIDKLIIKCVGTLLQEFTPLWREAKSSDLFNQKMLSISILDYKEEHTLVEGWVSFLWQWTIASLRPTKNRFLKNNNKLWLETSSSIFRWISKFLFFNSSKLCVNWNEWFLICLQECFSRLSSLHAASM